MAPRNLLLAGCGFLALAGCTTPPQSEVGPVWYYYRPPQTYAAPPRSYTAPQSSLPIYGETEAAPRTVEPLAPPPSPAPSRLATRPSPSQIDQPLEPADPTCGWWRLCNLWMGT